MTKAKLTALDAPQVTRARVAVSTSFFMFGLGFGLWAAHIPVIAARLGLDPAILGLGLLNVGLGGVISQPLAGWLIVRTGSRRAARFLSPMFLGAFLAPIIAWNTPTLFLGAFILGAVGGANNVALNTQASEIERARGRPTMSSFHGFFSLGALAGASLGGGIIAIGRQDGSGATVAAAAMAAIALFAGRHFLPAPPAHKSALDQERKGFAVPNVEVLVLAVLIFFSNTVEGSVSDWSALYLSTIRGLTVPTAVSGLVVFSLTMAICRLFGGPVVAKFGEKNMVLFGGLLMAIGMAAVVLSPWTVLSPFGFALVAIGAANTIPVMMSVASRAPGVAPSVAIATTATGALSGFLIGPPIIGFLAHALGLSMALGLLGLAGVVIVIGAALYHWPAPATNLPE